MPATPALILTATLDTLAGAAAGSLASPAKLVIALCGFGQTLPRIVGTAMLAQVGPWAVPSTGSQISTPIWGNDAITPSGTFYSIGVEDANHNIVQIGNYRFTGSGTIDLSNQTQIYPSPPLPIDLIPVYTNPPGATSQSIDGSLVVDGNLSSAIVDVSSVAGAITINGFLGNVFRIVLTENVTSVTLENLVQGAAYTFIIVQNATGGWTFAWPAAALNPVSPVNPVANGKTLWTATCDSDNTLIATGYYP